MTTQLEPADVAVRVDPDTEHAPETTEYVTAPLPDPPDVDSDNPTPKVPDVVVTESAA